MPEHVNEKSLFCWLVTNGSCIVMVMVSCVVMVMFLPNYLQLRVPCSLLVLYVFHSVVHSKPPWGHIEALRPVFHSRLRGSTDDRVLTSLRPESNFKLLV